ncbi:hypothetical protein, variant [Cryptococcus amylolentus CBS 6039]|uniref:Pre-mRNA-splicing factor SYF2 n=2 Tax=Cryptococcus amylolentus TaxID=104669 RepID=A0A1E3HLC2_9TREE|nr:hypothetical protein, variant [Cryptococcus amylolentus CBS 6039]ODN77163.1 hypothetical protein, variant [Cryptococcus amylolentus CBS 6039]ODO05005.1 hypothetical protein I350_05617 [Cryptococcus amylolentus CBS 6273]
MPPRKSKARDVKSTAPSPSPSVAATATRGSSRLSKSMSSNVGQSTDVETVTEEVQEESVEEKASTDAGVEESVEGEESAAPEDEGEAVKTGKVSMAERMAKMKELRMKMSQTSQENRRDLVADHQKNKTTAKDLARLEKQRKLAQTLRLKADAEEAGEDVERKKNWEYSIEDDERWAKKEAEKEAKQDQHFHNAEDDAWKRYERNIRGTKADLMAYERQKEAALGLAPGTLVPVAGGSSSAAGGSSALTKSEDLYRGADTLAYGDNKPSEEAVDRVMAKINKDVGKKKRGKKDEEDSEVDYINDRNRVFNKKISRYFDKYTKDIRANLERGTAL